MKIESLNELYLDLLRDLYNAEMQLTKVLPKMAEESTNAQLKAAFQSHLRETETHVQRLEKIFEELEEKPSGETCEAMQGLVKEGKEAISAKMPEAIKDAALICAAQKVEHYEIASYGTAAKYAQLLGMNDQAELLKQTLDEEKAADQKLTNLAESTINQEALAAA